MTLVFKICGKAEWAEAEALGHYHGSADDLRDGFIHLSTAAQLAGTLAKHFAGRDGLLLIAFEAEALASALKWETSRGGHLFPHLYAPLPADAVLWLRPLGRDEAGRHIIPPEALP